MIAPQLARRIDRLSRGAHLRHRYAHHPLCADYGAEVIAWRRMRVCRGCVAAGAGTIAGVVVAAAGALWLAAIVLAAGAVFGRKWHKRFVPTAVLASAITFAALHPSWLALGVATLAAATSGVWFVTYRRRGPRRTACQTCPHRTASPCPGFAPIVRRERAFSRLASRWIAAQAVLTTYKRLRQRGSYSAVK